MRIVGFSASNAVSFSDLTFPLNQGLTVVTGPNGSGKTSLGRIIDIVRLGLQSVGPSDRQALEVEYGTAGHNGSVVFRVGLRVSFNEDDRRILDDLLRASLVSSMALTQEAMTVRRRRLVQDAEDIGVDDLFGEGTFTVEHNNVSRNPWRITWATPTNQETGAPGMLLRLDTNMLTRADASSTTRGFPAHPDRGCSRGLNPPVSRSDRAM